MLYEQVSSFRKPAKADGQQESAVKSNQPSSSEPLIEPLPGGHVAQVRSFVSAYQSAFAIASVAAVLAVAGLAYYLVGKWQPEEDLVKQAEEAERLQAVQEERPDDKEGTVANVIRGMAALFAPSVPIVVILYHIPRRLSSYWEEYVSIIVTIASFLFPLIVPLFLGGIFGIASLMIYLFMFHVLFLLNNGDLNQWKTYLQELAVNLVLQAVLFLIWYFLDITCASVAALFLIIGYRFIVVKYFGQRRHD